METSKLAREAAVPGLIVIVPWRRCRRTSKSRIVTSSRITTTPPAAPPAMAAKGRDADWALVTEAPRSDEVIAIVDVAGAALVVGDMMLEDVSVGVTAVGASVLPA